MNKEEAFEEINNRLVRTFYFTDYQQVKTFVSKIMEMANKQKQHPDIVIHDDNVKISICDNGKVSEKCHKLANAICKIK